MRVTHRKGLPGLRQAKNLLDNFIRARLEDTD